MRLYASNTRISRSARRYAKLNQPMNPFDLTPRLGAGRADLLATAPAMTTFRRSLFVLMRTFRTPSRDVPQPAVG